MAHGGNRTGHARQVGESWRVDRVDHPVVPLLIALDRDDALVWVGLGARVADLVRHAHRHYARLMVETRPTTAARRQLREYLDGRRTRFDLGIRLLGTAFQRAAWWALCKIPYGETVSYAQQAAMVGSRAAARAVGRANAANPIPIVVPCHRVVGHDGDLTGFGGGIALKRWLLELESPQIGLDVWQLRGRTAQP